MTKLAIVMECSRCGLHLHFEVDATPEDEAWRVPKGTLLNDYLYRLVRSHAEPRVKVLV